MLKTNPLKPVDLVMLVIILLVAGVARFGGLRIVPFQYDEAIISERALDLAQKHVFPLTGNPSSVGVPTGPTSLYILALPFTFSSNPLVASAFIALLNTLGVGVLWLLTQRYFSRAAAWIAGLTYALNGWALIYSSKIWEPNIYPFFLLLAVLLGLYGFAEADTGKGHRWAGIFCLPLFLVAVQTHLAAWLLLPLYFIILWLNRRSLHRNELIVSISLGVITLLPYIVGIWQMYQAAPQIFQLAHHDNSITFSDQAIRMLAQFTSGLGYESVAKLDAFAPTLTVPLNLWPIIGVLTLVGVFSLLRRPRSMLVILLIAWVGIPLILFSFTWTALFTHYFTGVFPVLSLLTGVGAAWLYKLSQDHLPTLSKWLVLVAISLLVMTGGLGWARFVSAADTQPTGADFALPLHYLLDVKTKIESFKNIVVVGHDYWIGYGKEPKVWDVLLRDTACVRATGSHNFIVLPQGAFAALITPQADANPAQNVYLSQTSSTVMLRTGEKPYQINIFDHPPALAEANIIHFEPVQYGNGAQLTGYRWDQGALTLAWIITRPNENDYQYFVHILDANGERIAQRDTNFLPGLSWCTGDHVLTSTALDLPKGAATLRVGMYQLGLGGVAHNLVQVNVVDSIGNAISPWHDTSLAASSTP